MNNKEKIIYRLSMIIIVFTLVLSGYIGYLLFYPFEPASLGNVPFPVENKIIKQGERVRYFVEYHKLMNVPARANHQLVNHVQINFSDVASFLPKGDYEVWNHDITIPEFVSPGKYYLVITWTYKINPIREIVISSRTEEFEVIAK